MRVLVTGAGGQLGTDLLVAFEGHEVVGLTSRGDRDAVMQAITTIRPDAVVHAGAWTAVDACESDPDRAFQSNALGTRHVMEAARVVGAQVCYVSTAYVFDGTSSAPYVEWDQPNPLSVYGRSKLGGEQEIDPGSSIVRTSAVWSAHGANIVKTILRLASERGRFSFVDDQRDCPTFSGDLASMIRRLVVARLPGTFHVTSQGATTWFEFARAVMAAAGHDPGRVEPTTTANLPRPAPRPANAVLDNAALRLQGIPLLPHWSEPLERVVKELMA